MHFDEIAAKARLTVKRNIDCQKKDAKGVGQGVVAWDVEVNNQMGEVVASYDISTLVAMKAWSGPTAFKSTLYWGVLTCEVTSFKYKNCFKLLKA